MNNTQKSSKHADYWPGQTHHRDMYSQDVIQVKCSTTIKNILCEALRNYASAPDTSHHRCTGTHNGQRLLSTAKQIENEFSRNHEFVVINKNFYSDYAAAINHHYDEIQQKLNTDVDQQRQLMLNVLNGTPTQDNELDHALHQDHVV